MKLFVKYLLLTVGLVLMSSGAVIAATMEIYDSIGYRVLWFLVPSTMLFLTAVLVNNLIAIPRLLLKRKYEAYFIFTFCFSYILIAILFGVESLMRNAMDQPLRIKDFTSLWLWVDCLSNCILLFVVLAGIGAIQLYEVMKKETMREVTLSVRLKKYMSAVRDRLSPTPIFRALDSISETLRCGTGPVGEMIRSLSDYLRRQLYELPSPPSLGDFDDEEELDSVTFVPRFITSRQKRWLRHLLFQIILLAISFDTFFDSPDHPEFTMHRASGVISMYLILNVLSYFNICVLARGFRKHHNVRKYVRNVVVFIMVLIVPIIVVQILSYDMNLYVRNLPVLFMVLSTGGTVVTLTLFIGGVAMVMILKDWIIETRRVALLKAEAVRQEYAYLKKQINPHFLFNVLNNIDILADEEPAEAKVMVDNMKRVLQYELNDAKKESTTLAEEIEFLRTYLALECTRIEPFAFEIDCIDADGKIEVPTLMFITFVENAVKHSSVIDAKRYVHLTFSKGDEFLIFTCVNTFRMVKSNAKRPGGIGLANTRRRLELLYGDNFKLEQNKDGHEFITTLKIPVNYELHNHR